MAASGHPGPAAAAPSLSTVDRSLQVADASRQIEQALRDGMPVLLFPEGTSSDGSSVLPFRSPLFDPAIRAGAASPRRRFATTPTMRPRTEVTYWGEMVFVPHLFRTLCVRGLAAEIRFDSPCGFPIARPRRGWHGQVHALRRSGAALARGIAVLSLTS